MEILNAILLLWAGIIIIFLSFKIFEKRIKVSNLELIKLLNVSRLELFDKNGKFFEKTDTNFDFQFEDNNTTLKIFLK